MGDQFIYIYIFFYFAFVTFLLLGCLIIFNSSVCTQLFYHFVIFFPICYILFTSFLSNVFFDCLTHFKWFIYFLIYIYMTYIFFKKNSCTILLLKLIPLTRTNYYYNNIIISGQSKLKKI